MIFDLNNDSNNCNTTIVYNFTTKKSNYNRSLINKRAFNKNNLYKNTTIQDNINYTKTFKINTNHQNRKITYQNNFINNNIHKWINQKIL